MKRTWWISIAACVAVAAVAIAQRTIVPGQGTRCPECSTIAPIAKAELLQEDNPNWTILITSSADTTEIRLARYIPGHTGSFSSVVDDAFTVKTEDLYAFLKEALKDKIVKQEGR